MEFGRQDRSNLKTASCWITKLAKYSVHSLLAVHALVQLDAKTVSFFEQMEERYEC
jgi:hypothetical protein